MEHHHVQQQDVLRLSHRDHVESLARHIFRNNPPALLHVERLFSTKPLPVELTTPKPRNLVFHPPY